VGDTTFDAAVQPDASLKLSRFVRSDNRTKAHQRAVDTVSNELQHRRSDLTAIDEQLKLLMARAMDGGDDAEEVGQEMAQMMAVKGQHTRRIAELEAQGTVSVTFQQTRKGCSVYLVPGVWTKLSWFPKPVVWCPVVEEKDEEDTVDVTEDLPLVLVEEKEDKVLVEQGHIYAIGGANGGASTCGERFDPATNSWTAVAAMSTKRYCFTVASL
jgi:hypothetical protein